MEPMINGGINIRKGLESWGLPPIVIFCLFLRPASGGTGLFALHRPPSSGGGSLLPSLARSACRMRMRKRMSPPRRMRSGWFMPPPWFVSSQTIYLSVNVSPQTTRTHSFTPPWFVSSQTIYLCPHKPSTSDPTYPFLLPTTQTQPKAFI